MYPSAETHLQEGVVATYIGRWVELYRMAKKAI